MINLRAVIQGHEVSLAFASANQADDFVAKCDRGVQALVSVNTPHSGWLLVRPSAVGAIEAF